MNQKQIHKIIKYIELKVRKQGTHHQMNGLERLLSNEKDRITNDPPRQYLP